MQREVANYKDRKLRETYQNFRQAVNKNWCSASLCVYTFNGITDKELLVMRLQYFAIDLSALHNEIIFAAPFESTTNDIFLSNFIKRFKHFGGDEKDLQRMKIVTPNDKFFSKALIYPLSRSKCVVNAIIQILDDAYDDCTSGELVDFFMCCRKIVRYVNDSNKYDFSLECDNGSWKGKMAMMESINAHYDDLVVISNNDNKFDFQFNKIKSEELVSFLSPFIEAADDLASTEHTTANKIFVWWAVLNDHLQAFNEYSNERKAMMLCARNSFRLAFPVTMEEKINCFLDPRFKQLLMLAESEREHVMKEVRSLLRESTVEPDGSDEASSSGTSHAKKSRLENFESQKSISNSRTKPRDNGKGRSRISKYEASEPIAEENDEVTIYLKLPLLNSSDFVKEFDIISKFWGMDLRDKP